MLNGLTAINFESNLYIDESLEKKIFIMKTCQRTLVIGMGQKPIDLIEDRHYQALNEARVYRGRQAYQFLLETLCGLQSHILGESEITSQFKKAFQNYITACGSNPHFMTIMEKLFKDAKEIRTQHLRHMTRASYPGLARKLIHQRELNNKRVLILGSGDLAEEFLRNMYKRFSVTLSARNFEKVVELTEKYPSEQMKWLDKNNYLNFNCILNTIGSQEIFFENDFFDSWKDIHNNRGLIADFGHPTPFNCELKQNQGYYNLQAIFDFSKQFNQQRIETKENALSAIEGITVKRENALKLNLPFGWEELSFA